MPTSSAALAPSSSPFRASSPLALASWLVLPSISLVVLLAVLNRMPPFFAWYIDPTYPYLLNGLSLTQGLAPGHTDHPGTSLQIFMALVIAACHPVIGGQSTVVASVIGSPETYLQFTGIAQALLFAATFSIASYRVGKFFGYRLGLAFSLLVLSAINLWLPWVVVATPESLVASMSLLFVAILAPALRSPRTEISSLMLVSAGIVLAIAITAKVIALPLTLLAIVLLKPKRSLPLLLTTAVTSVVILIPVLNQLPRMISWYSSVGTGTARYGQEASTTVTQNVMTAAQILTLQYPLVLLALVLAVVALLLYVISRQSSIVELTQTRSTISVLLTVLATLAFGIKVSHERDFITLTVLIPTLLVVSSTLIMGLRSSSQLISPRIGQHLTTTLLLVLFIASSLLVGMTLQSFSQVIQSANQRLDDYESLPPTSSARGVTFDVPDQTYALYFGDGWTRSDAFMAEIGSATAGVLDFDPWAQTLTGTAPNGSIGPLDCSDLRNLLDDRGLVLQMPQASLNVADPDATGTITFQPGFNIYYDPDQNIVTPGDFTRVTILACSQ